MLLIKSFKMTSITPPDSVCPKCKSDAHVTSKALLIGHASPKVLFPDEEPSGYKRRDQLAVDECNPEELKAAPLKQFFDGYYCNLCGLGFVPDRFLIRT